MLTVEEAQARVLEGVQPLPTESVPLAEARGRVLAARVIATRAQPPADNSAMDGYAVRWADVSYLQADDLGCDGGGGGGAVELVVADEIPAGGWSERTLLRGEAARIFTGAPIPPGADHVIMQERTSRDGDVVVIESTGPGPGDNIRRAGEDLAPGDVVGPAGVPLRGADLQLLASQGVATVDVHRRPVVAIVSTGDEVHEPGTDVPRGHIYNGNAYALMAMVEEAGGIPKYLGIARDTPDALREVFGRAAGCDATISIGGVSVGDYDYVRDVLAEMGEQTFWKVAMRPGKPNASGTLHGAPYFGLPGNPVSCLVSFLQYVRPALRRLQGCGALFLPTRDAVLAEPLKSKAKFLILYRGRLGPDGTVRLTGPQGSGVSRSMAEANCLISVPEGIADVAAGETVRVQLLPGSGAAQGEPGLRR